LEQWQIPSTFCGHVQLFKASHILIVTSIIFVNKFYVKPFFLLRLTYKGGNRARALTRGTLNPRSFYREFRLRGDGPAGELDSADLVSGIPSGSLIYM